MNIETIDGKRVKNNKERIKKVKIVREDSEIIDEDESLIPFIRMDNKLILPYDVNKESSQIKLETNNYETKIEEFEKEIESKFNEKELASKLSPMEKEDMKLKEEIEKRHILKKTVDYTQLVNKRVGYTFYESFSIKKLIESEVKHETYLQIE